MSNRSSAPLFATVNITTACNLDCAYCFMQPRSNEYMLQDDFRRVIQELAGLRLFFINLSGGEPFLHPDINSFIHLAHDYFQHVMILTNGSRLNRQHINTIQEILRKKKTFTMQVSLDSAIPEIHNSTRGRWIATFENIKILSSLGVHLIVAMVVTNRSVGFIEQSIEELSGYTRFFHLMTIQDIRSRDGIEQKFRFAGSLEEQRPLWERIRSFGQKRNLIINTPLNYEGDRGCATGAPCMAAFSHIVIDPSLKVRPCDRLTDIVIGDLKQSSLAEIWNGNPAQKIIKSSVPFCRLSRKTALQFGS